MKDQQAFPSTEEQWYEETRIDGAYNPGMTLRDYFAGQFVAGYSRKWEEITDSTFNEIAKQAYELADAMLKERDK